MSALQTELRRLYGEGRAEAGRAMVLEIVGAPGWRALGRVWQGVQEALELPAPAIAVSGTDGLQLWFSLAEAVPAPRALAFLQALQARFLSDIKPDRVRLAAGPAAPVPALQTGSGNWSAFVAPDLAPVFDDSPWLDIEPNEDGQASLLRALRPMAPAAFAAAMDLLSPPSDAAPAAAPAPGGTPPGPALPTAVGEDDPRRFLLRVMADESVPLALRIEAAKALLPRT